MVKVWYEACGQKKKYVASGTFVPSLPALMSNYLAIHHAGCWRDEGGLYVGDEKAGEYDALHFKGTVKAPF